MCVCVTLVHIFALGSAKFMYTYFTTRTYDQVYILYKYIYNNRKPDQFPNGDGFWWLCRCAVLEIISNDMCLARKHKFAIRARQTIVFN